MGRKSTTGGVKPAGDRIEVRFTYQGRELRPTLALKPTAANLKHAVRLRASIVDEIKAGIFSITAHFPDYKFQAAIAAEDDVTGRTFADWALVWGRLAERDREHSTISIYKSHLAHSWTSAIGHLHPRKITEETLLERLTVLATDQVDEVTGEVTRKGLARKTQNNVLIPLRAVCSMYAKALRIPDPSADIKCFKTQAPPPDPFSSQEVDLILADMRTPRGKIGAERAQALADYYEFAAYAGPRPTEHIELRWSDVDCATRSVRVSRATVMGKTKARTKTGPARVVELNDRAWAVIERQRARTQLRDGPGGLIFINPATADGWASTDEQRREWARCLQRVGVRYRPPKELRDTSVVMSLSSGADPYWVARMHGHSLQTMLKNYAGWIPDADRGRNRRAVNASLTSADSAVDPSVAPAQNLKT